MARERPDHLYTEGTTCKTPQRSCLGAIELGSFSRGEACQWCLRCFWCSDILGCPKAPREQSAATASPGVIATTSDAGTDRSGRPETLPIGEAV